MATTLKTAFTTDEAGEYLGVDPSMVRRYCRQKKISAKKIGRDWLIEKNELDKFEPQPRGNPQFQK